MYEKQQQILLSLSDILIEIYFSESALYRTLKNIDNQGIESQTTQENMVQFYVFEAYNIIHKSAREIILSISDGKEQEQLLKILILPLMVIFIPLPQTQLHQVFGMGLQMIMLLLVVGKLKMVKHLPDTVARIILAHVREIVVFIMHILRLQIQMVRVHLYFNLIHFLLQHQQHYLFISI